MLRRVLHTTPSFLSGLMLVSSVLLSLVSVPVHAAQESGSVGLEGRISAPPPTVGASISIPRSGQTFTEVPITVSGICPNDLLVKVFKNNVFAGSVQCEGGSFQLTMDLFNGTNEIVARVYDTLDQAGPDSNIVTVTYNDAEFGVFGTPVSLTSSFAKRGANPGELLTWPIILSGGNGPYALSIDWGDGTANELKSQEFPGAINLEHTYQSSGIYRILIKVTDKNGSTAFLQLVGVANGVPAQANESGEGGADNTITKVVVVWWPAAVALPLLVCSFWLGKRHELFVLRRQLDRTPRA